MCGLVGMAGNIYDPEKKVFRELLIHDLVRGEDSTGVAMADRNKDVTYVAKATGSPINLYNTNPGNLFHNGVISPTVRTVIGHNRSATRGRVIAENAHPFEHGDIVGAHNGTLINVKHLDKGDEFEVDSEAIFYNLDKYGPHETIPRIHGAYALTWWNKAESKLYIIRNKERPLYYTRNKLRDMYYWASETWMLSVALARHGIEHGDFYSFEPNHLYSLVVDNLWGKDWKDSEFTDEGEILGYTPPPPPAATGNRSITFPSATSTATRYVGGKWDDKDGSWVQKEKDRAKASKLDKLVGKSIDFYTEGEEEGLNGLTYLVGKPVEVLDDYEIRIYGTTHKSYEAWKLEATCWTGTVKKVQINRINGKYEEYLLIDLRTIKPMADPKTPKVKAYNDVEITIDEWTNLTSNGCAWCASDLSLKDDNMWISYKECICPQCKNNPDLVPFLHMKNIVN